MNLSPFVYTRNFQKLNRLLIIVVVGTGSVYTGLEAPTKPSQAGEIISAGLLTILMAFASYLLGLRLGARVNKVRIDRTKNASLRSALEGKKIILESKTFWQGAIATSGDSYRTYRVGGETIDIFYNEFSIEGASEALPGTLHQLHNQKISKIHK